MSDLGNLGVDELFALARASEEPDAYWACVTELHRRGGDRAFALGEVLCDSILPGERCLGADVLGQLQGATGDARPVLRRLLDEGDQPAVLAAAVAALGFLHDAQSLDRVEALASHEEEGVRFAAVNALMRIDPERTIALLTELAAQRDGELGAWAEHALAQLRGS